MKWLPALISAIFAFIVETRIERAITDWAKSAVKGDFLAMALIEIVSFLALFSGLLLFQ